ncbi:MAG: Gfo/Idh/MocA family oxidoreductase [Gemmataceae bacterium]|nr:Gfo/Idh/MocA family oxidoreductase [Gemmataceae bacterium]MCI0742876.1 Gfo/Idh/MocA family oxidoreductase [Gemmataceae bacterium]
MNKGNLSRRGFLARSVATAVGAGLPLWYAKEMVADAQEKKQKDNGGANGRLVMAAIGTGTNRTRRSGNQQLHGERGVQIMNDAMDQQGVQMIAVCDVDRPNAEFAAGVVNRRYSTNDCRVYTDFRELLQNRTIDAVTIGTPDHWHALVAIAAMRAGKHVYCEKPLTLTVEEGKAMVRVARETNRILQTGSQQRSDARFRLACELVRNNRIGHIRQITTLIGDNPVGGPFNVEQPPEGLDWNFWLGPTPRVDYIRQRCHYDFRWWYDYSGGKMTDWGAHHNDIAQWALGMDESGPVSVQGTGTAPATGDRSFNCHPRFEVTYTYANGGNGREGTRLVCRAVPAEGWRHPNNGVLFEGEDNKWIFVNRGTITASDGNARESRILTEPLAQNATRLEVSANHMGNFMQGVRNRRQPICHVGVGHRSCSVCHLGNIATRFFTGQRLTWNPQEERFTGDRAEEANRHLGRPYREPWRLTT